MAKKPQSEHHIRAWRKYRDLTLEQLAERIGMTHQNLGKIERGLVPYNQILLEALSVELRTTPAKLINVDPTRDDATWSLWENASPAERKQAAAVIAALKGTGTDG